MSRPGKRRIETSRLKAFTSFSDSFSTSLKSGWKVWDGTWTSQSNSLSSSNSTGLLTVPISKSNVTASINLPVGSGMGISFWVKDSANYWAAFPYSSSYQVSTCVNQSCSGTENYTVTQNCSCPFVGYSYPSTCNSGACSGSETFTNYRSCSCPARSTSNCSNQSCSGTETFTNTRSCSCSTVGLYGYCTYTTNSQTVVRGCYSGFSGCSNPGDTETVAPGICGCPTGQNKVCCSYTQTTQVWSYSCCSYTGQVCQYGSTNQSTCNNGSCSGTETFTDTRSCSCTTTYPSTCNNGSCSGVEAFTDTRSCSCPQTPVYSSTCNNGACSGTYSYQASRNCSCTTNYTRSVKIVKVINGTQSDIGSISISSLPTSVSVTTSGNSVTVSGSGFSQGFTNSDSTIYKNFGIIKSNGGAEQSSAISSFSVTAN
jgi:hypothetical protein